MYPRVRLLIAGSLAFLLGACAATGPVSSVWIQPGQTPRQYERLVVFGVTNNPKVRRAYEDNFVKRLQTLGITTWASHELVSDRQLGRLARMTEGYAKVKADGVLITHLVTDESASTQPAARIGSVPDHDHHLIGYFSRVYDEVSTPGYYSDPKALRLETNLYDAKQERLVWSGRSQPLDPNSEHTTLSQVIDEVIAQMQRDGLLPNRPLEQRTSE
ncbi:hypothetical protein [Thermochromatium tepidum]|jgi:hypothetical protein|uniref:DUF4136 domain-containing protein n=1 Tax=Thermochromatium tepidum ATCC 43061 TaxID=316276 RepID=A0A6I6E9Y1_THETI|nr:hypothetical protein [Thermochromatium tepidum]QGU31739.1 hypothetical protein E6P07_01255 [Thermochromatium tepidum ATCC 43061]